MRVYYTSVYEKEQLRLEEKIRPLQRFEENIRKVEEIYLDIKRLIEHKNHIELLS